MAETLVHAVPLPHLDLEKIVDQICGCEGKTNYVTKVISHRLILTAFNRLLKKNCSQQEINIKWQEQEGGGYSGFTTHQQLFPPLCGRSCSLGSWGEFGSESLDRRREETREDRENQTCRWGGHYRGCWVSVWHWHTGAARPPCSNESEGHADC